MAAQASQFMANFAGLVDLAGWAADHEGNWLDELIFVGNLMDHYFPPEPGMVGPPRRFNLPSSFLVFDIETSGFNPNEDVIVELGWAIVQDHQVVDHAGMLLNWTLFDPDNRNFHDWLRWRLQQTTASCLQQGRRYHITYERLRDEGVPPAEGVYDFAQLLWTFLNANAFLVGHGAWKFDRRRIDLITQQFLDYTLPWHQSPIFDTGLIEKASQLNKVPCETETLDEWYRRVNGTWSRVKWNLDGHAARKYDLANRYHLDLSLAHTAGFDCLLTYSLAETYRLIGEACRGVEQD